MITNIIYKQIYALCQMDLNIIQVGEEFFTCLYIETSTSGNTSSIDFNTFSGICITEFINMDNIRAMNNPPLFLQQFERFIEPLEPVTVKFNKNIPYMLFSK